MNRLNLLKEFFLKDKEIWRQAEELLKELEGYEQIKEVVKDDE